MGALNARLAHLLPFRMNEMAYHPVVWWKQDSAVMADVLSPYCMAVFSVFPSSAGPERSFKSRSRVVTTVRNRMSKGNIDMQSGLIFSGTQAKRFLVDIVDEALGIKALGHHAGPLDRRSCDYRE